jgi:cytoskeletal protein CcmA (bactofilin family)
VIGPKIHVNGEISGDENLVVEGRVDGKINLKEHQVDIGQSGKVHADVAAKTVRISGEVRGDVKGYEKVIISRSGNVCGNIIAPRLTLEDGAKFKGSIDMDPGGKAASDKTLSAVKAPEAAKKSVPSAPKPAAQKPAANADKDNKQSSLGIKGG